MAKSAICEEYIKHQQRGNAKKISCELQLSHFSFFTVINVDEKNNKKVNKANKESYVNKFTYGYFHTLVIVVKHTSKCIAASWTLFEGSLYFGDLRIRV